MILRNSDKLCVTRIRFNYHQRSLLPTVTHLNYTQDGYDGLSNLGADYREICKGKKVRISHYR